MAYTILDDRGTELDARIDLDENGIVLHSRGGSKSSPSARNTDYGPALRLLLMRLQQRGISVDGAWVDSSRVQHLALNERQVLHPADMSRPAEETYTLISERMTKVGQLPSRKGGNPTKRLRFELKQSYDVKWMEDSLALRKSGGRSSDRLPASELQRVHADHLYRAVLHLRERPNDHPFGPSTDFDLLTDDGLRLPPKAVFGVALTEALGFQALPKHFSGGIGTPCFLALQRAGYAIVPKGSAYEPIPIPNSSEDREWTEGKPRLVLHLKRERGAGIAQAKKDSFISEHGVLFCERCEMRPSKVFGSEHGDACIEVHHRATMVQDMSDGHVTRLEDLQCLCANCHRYVHRLMKVGALDV